MAKDQDLPLNPLKISGACGRLMCCLKYEHPLYQEFKADLPAIGAHASRPTRARAGWSATTFPPATWWSGCRHRVSAGRAARPASAAHARPTTDGVREPSRASASRWPRPLPAWRVRTAHRSAAHTTPATSAASSSAHRRRPVPADPGNGSRGRVHAPAPATTAVLARDHDGSTRDGHPRPIRGGSRHVLRHPRRLEVLHG